MTDDLFHDLDVTLDRAKDRALSVAELKRIAAALRASEPSKNRYRLLHILGRGGGPEFEEVVAPYLRCESDPMLARLAIQILCDYWDLDAKYRDVVLDFVRGAAVWDVDNVARQAAMTAAGEYLRWTRDPEILEAVLAVALDESEWELTREDAVEALARATYQSWEEMPPASRREPLDSLWSLDVIEAAKKRLANDKA